MSLISGVNNTFLCRDVRWVAVDEEGMDRLYVKV